ncbi:MAG TPA: uroporphyrinogen-III synthase [Bacteroidota bacterium]
MNDVKKQFGTASATSFPLRGKTVLITRPREQAGEFSQLLRDRGATTVFVPTIEIVPPRSWQPCDDAIDAIRTYDGVIFTSANAVRLLFGRMRERNLASCLEHARTMTIYVVGSKTGDALVAEGLKPTHMIDVQNSRQLAEALLRAPIRGKRLLFPKGNLASGEPAELLRSAGAAVDEVTVYDTVAPRDADASAIGEILRNDAIGIVTFFSPSSVKYLVSIVPREFLLSKTIAVIGTTTAAAVKEAALPVHVLPEHPTSADLVDAIVQYYQAKEREAV